MNRKLKGDLMLLLTALIWGTAFVAQSAGMDHVGPFTYNGVRNLIAGFVLFPVTAVFDRLRHDSVPADVRARSRRYGAICGIFLFIASSLQQCGISMTIAGKAGFITALYIVLVPVLGIFLGKKVSPVIWLSVAIAVAGFYLLCIRDGFSIGLGDFLVLLCAVFFSIHILVIDSFNARAIDGVRMSQAQFFTVALLSVPPILLTESPDPAGILAARWPILYAAVMSSGVAYTLQILGQRYTDPASATLLMSLESVFAALSGWLLLHERLSGREMLGCALVFAAVLLAQLPVGSKSRGD